MKISLNQYLSSVKLFSYFSVPDPEKSPLEFENEWAKSVKLIINENFQGRIAFNVLCDASRFSVDLTLKIENVEKYIRSISNSKFLRTYKVGEVDSALNDVLDIGFPMHDDVDNENGSFSKILR